MAGFVKKAAVYLGLVDDEYDDFEANYDEPQSAPAPRQVRSVGDANDGAAAGASSIRTLPPREDQSGVTLREPRAVVRPIQQPMMTAKVHVVEPTSFPDAQEIGDRLKASQPVIVSMQACDADLSRRLIDFCSGATYVLGGTMERVADKVFLLTPSNVEVSAEEKRRLQERNYRS